MPSLSPASAEAPDTTFAALQAAIARIERGGSAAVRREAVPLGLPAIDDALPGGGLAAGVVHEATGSAAGGFVAMAAGRFAGPVLWCVMASSRSELYGPGLAAFGLDTRNLVIARCKSRQDMLWAMEEGLRDPALAVVVGEPDRAVALTASRRLQLAAETGGVTGLVLRRGAEEGALAPSAVFSRWRADSIPAPAAGSVPTPPKQPLRLRRPDRPPSSEDRRATTRAPAEGTRWRLSLLRCRGGLEMRAAWPKHWPKSWIVDWCDATRDLSLVPGAGHRPAAAGAGELLAG
jgi:protein ImuA